MKIITGSKRDFNFKEKTTSFLLNIVTRQNFLSQIVKYKLTFFHRKPVDSITLPQNERTIIK